MYFALAIVYLALLLVVILFLAGATRLANQAESRRKTIPTKRGISERILFFKKRYRDAA